MRQRARRPIRSLLALTLAMPALIGCARPSPPPVAQAAAAPVVRAAPTAAAPRIAQPAFCAVLRDLIAAGSDSFTALRASPLGVERWTGKKMVPGTERCTIEGAAWPRARYACAGAPLPADQRERVAAQFALLSEQIDRCLDQPAWSPRSWQKGLPFAFAMGERQQTWTDRSTLPPSAVILRLQRGLSGRDYRVRLDLTTIR